MGREPLKITPRLKKSGWRCPCGWSILMMMYFNFWDPLVSGGCNQIVSTGWSLNSRVGNLDHRNQNNIKQPDFLECYTNLTNQRSLQVHRPLLYAPHGAPRAECREIWRPSRAARGPDRAGAEGAEGGEVGRVLRCWSFGWWMFDGSKRRGCSS